MHKVILDTNVIVSALIGKSYPYKILYELVAPTKIELQVSPEVLEEYYRVLADDKFSDYPDFVQNAKRILALVEQLAKSFTASINLEVIKDISDNKFLALAVTGQSDFIITGNTKHFTFKKFQNIEIISPGEYWNQFWR